MAMDWLRWRKASDGTYQNVDENNPLPVTLEGSGGSSAVTIADGANVTQGAKADSAATDSTSSWSVVALLKGMLAQLLSTNPVQINRSDLYANLTTQATTTVKSGAGTLAKIVINKPVASGVIAIYDSLSGSGTSIGTITNPGTLLNEGPLGAAYDVGFGTGLTIVTSGATQDITVCYR